MNQKEKHELKVFINHVLKKKWLDYRLVCWCSIPFMSSKLIYSLSTCIGHIVSDEMDRW